MLRWAIWLLVLANAGYFAWSQGYLASIGYAPPQVREPQRLDAQIKPEAQRLLNTPRDIAPESPPVNAPAAEREIELPTPAQPAETVAPPPAPVPAPPVTEAAEAARTCWQAGAFTEAQADGLRAALTLAGLPASSWQMNESRSGGRWIVYMGRYDNEEQLERKKAELRELKVAFREVSGGLSPGLALGTYSSDASAQQALQEVARTGVRTARVAQERAESLNFTLRLPAITPAQRRAVAALGAPLAGKALQPCN
ncbi:SPOR domain-containing protein [Hydrogenophaga sp.]|uniref:SPOR domain-containing protein n=1 Tax=Hydrogenophaga sp. TaxID=1904254 RepID=UPI0025BF8DFB|nr:SPOR domain-containing protein [Hydrogenophaga sp.]